MKKPVQQFGKLIVLVALGCMIFVSCSKDDTPDVKKEDARTNPDGIEQGSVVIATEDLLTMDSTKIIQSLKSSKSRKL